MLGGFFLFEGLTGVQRASEAFHVGLFEIQNSERPTIRVDFPVRLLGMRIQDSDVCGLVSMSGLKRQCDCSVSPSQRVIWRLISALFVLVVLS